MLSHTKFHYRHIRIGLPVLSQSGKSLVYFKTSLSAARLIFRHIAVTYACVAPFLWELLLGRKCWTCLYPPLITCDQEASLSSPHIVLAILLTNLLVYNAPFTWQLGLPLSSSLLLDYSIEYRIEYSSIRIKPEVEISLSKWLSYGVISTRTQCPK